MSESIAEMILPSTYIEVRAEGLIGVGSIATGNLGVVGTAARGPVGTVVSLGSYAEALDAFGSSDPFATPRLVGNPLTLVRALEQAFTGGAKSVYAVRIANGVPAKATAALRASGDQPGFTLTAKDGGTYGTLITWMVAQEAAAQPWKLTLVAGAAKEVYSGMTVAELRTAALASTLVDIGAVSNGASEPMPRSPAVALAGGTDGANVSAVDLAAGLAKLEDQPVNILIVGGFGSAAARGAVGAHLENTENEGRERIAVLGATASDAATVLAEAGGVSDDRIVLVGPGLMSTDPNGTAVALPPPYLAAVVAGKMATLAVHVSLTNKTVPIDDLDVRYNTTQYKNLLLNRVLLVRQKFGFQVVKGISTENGAFTQITIRRIVDYAKAGVRQGSDPYIGRLNNGRVRGALKATLDGFLSQMVVDEMLVAYQLDVSATRAQEIRGICAVTMTLLPTFSIDYIRVTMNLQ